jgi:plastocyanin
MDRREFLTKAGLLATWSLVAVSVSSCSDDDSPSGPTGGDGSVTGVVTEGGHSHAGARITEVQLAAGDAVNLTLTGNGHTHTVGLSAQQVVGIADGLEVVQATLPDGTGHSHTVTFN